MKHHTLSIITGFALACTPSSLADLPGATLTNGGDTTLQKDVLSDMSVTERALSPRCQEVAGCSDGHIQTAEDAWQGEGHRSRVGSVG